MSQDFTDDCFDASHVVATDQAIVENNFAALKSSFSGANDPANPVAGLIRLNTTTHRLGVRNEANGAYLEIWDMVNNKPIIANLSNEITDAMIAAALKDPAAGTPGLRTLGTGAAAACAGNDARLSDTRTPADSSITAAKFPAPTAGDYYLISCSPWYTSAGSYQLYAQFYCPKAGAIRTRVGIKAGGAELYVYARVYKNGSAVGTERNSSSGNYSYYNEDFNISAGDLIQLYMYGTGGYGYMIIGIGNPWFLSPRISDI